MRLLHPDGTTIHLAYCTNVHQAEDLDGVIEQLDRYAEPVRERLVTDRLGLGLWLAQPAATALAQGESALHRLRRELDTRGLEVVTLNGFPYRGFHEPVVKRGVYRPDWTDPARLAYTVDLARILAVLLPDDALRGSISTLPLAWRHPRTDRHESAGLRALNQLAENLAKISALTGRLLRVGLEPEPGCTIATVHDACTRLREIDTEYLGVCLDTCHLAVDFEDPHTAVRELAAAGLPVVKAQLANALLADDPADPAARTALGRFAEPRFLHQTRAAAVPEPTRWDDLDQALDTQAPGPWRIHYHVPLHADPQPPLGSTRPVLTDAINALIVSAHPVTDHLEVETYTWSVLPEQARPTGDRALVRQIAAELAWARDQLLALGLRAEHR